MSTPRAPSSALFCVLACVAAGADTGCAMSSRAGATVPQASSQERTVQPSPPPPPPADEVPPADRAAHIEDAMAQLTDAERSLDQELTRKSSPRPPPPKPPPSTGPEAPKATPLAEPCDVACVALASMRRSAAYLCKLAGSTDSRCSDARDRVRRAVDRVTTACGACPTDTPLSMFIAGEGEVALDR